MRMICQMGHVEFMKAGGNFSVCSANPVWPKWWGWKQEEMAAGRE
jgi:hypothetical protein